MNASRWIKNITWEKLVIEKNFAVDADVKMSMHRIPNGLKNVNNHNNVAQK